mmetsp:Transcript_18293/g.43006  ORF Transcript_18293/g.43006 Transcript_18293/m.43006 type:complete len:176 (-) Transcript_18293:148-675(-)|eukprot:CAMPEP_0114550650 /NCGR_PEP_ID=MMETSP0114-20121206/6182_1 /TAXON_ID=31324 /ORGANISM="Goniomonas sp, Strain m" /LENGTH=175 /DNA_ID=CAMNT_0001735429 /DNA_START=45 /DNA_END=572 /DNA_ORIENTATION=-
MRRFGDLDEDLRAVSQVVSEPTLSEEEDSEMDEAEDTFEVDDLADSGSKRRNRGGRSGRKRSCEQSSAFFYSKTTGPSLPPPCVAEDPDAELRLMQAMGLPTELSGVAMTASHDYEVWAVCTATQYSSVCHSKPAAVAAAAPTVAGRRKAQEPPDDWMEGMAKTPLVIGSLLATL